MTTKELQDKLFINTHLINKLSKIKSCLILTLKGQMKMHSKGILQSSELKKFNNSKLYFKINIKILSSKSIH